MLVAKVRSPLVIEIPNLGENHSGSKVILKVWNSGESEPSILTSVVILGTAGTFSCASTQLALNDRITISGVFGGTGSITNYTSPKTYYVSATNGSTTFTLSNSIGGASIVTTAGTPTGLTFINQISGYFSLSKSNPSVSQKDTSYNVSNYVKGFIENIKPTKISAYANEDVNEWCIFRVTSFWFNSATSVYNQFSDDYYYGINGFTNYSQGYNSVINSSSTGFLSNKLISKNILKSSSSLKSYVNWMGEFATGYTLQLVYTTLDTGSSVIQNITGLSAGVKNIKIPLTLYPTNINYILGNKLDVNLLNASSAIIATDTLYLYINEECKYTPVECTFINRYGGWEFLTFFKAQSNSVSVKGTNYQLTQSTLDYNVSIGQFKMMNINGRQSIKLNTGWVDENYSELITDLMLSETILLDGKPAIVKTQSADFKSTLKDKNINYEVEFEYAFNIVNDAV